MTSKQFVEFCKKAKDKPCKYMWGTYGTTQNKKYIDDEIITSKTRQYPSHYDAKYQAELRGVIGTHIGCDCTGLIKWFLWTGGDIEKAPKYNADTDTSASGWYGRAKVRGKIQDMPEREGLIVSFSGHCGVYIGNGEVIECTKGVFGNGVVKTKLTDRNWEKWCECRYIDYAEETTPKSEITLIPARVKKDCAAWAGLNRRHQVGDIYTEDVIQYIGVYQNMAAVIYPTGSTQKVAFVDLNNILL